MVAFIFIVFCIEIPINHVDFDMPRSVAPDHGLHCLHITIKGVSGLKRVEIKSR